MKHNKENAKEFVTWLAIAFLMIVCILQSGCQTVAGFGRDVTWLAESSETALQDK